MLNIGCHLSVSKGYLHMAELAHELGGNTFQFFTRNPRGGSAKALDADDARAMVAFMQKHAFAPILAHAPYTLNPASSEAKGQNFAHLVFNEDLERMEHMPGNLYNFHPGAHGANSMADGISAVIKIMNDVLYAQQSTTVLLETMSGKGTEIGSTFAQLRQIIDGVKLNDKLGVCLDTCHVFAAGYDVVHKLDDVLAEFDKTIGLERLKAVHLNDSMTPFDSRKDRHALIGAGTIGMEAITHVINHPQLKHLPFFLETPTEDAGHGEEIAKLKAAYKD